MHLIWSKNYALPPCLFLITRHYYIWGLKCRSTCLIIILEGHDIYICWEFCRQGETLALIWDVWYFIEGDREVYPVFWYIREYGVTILLKALGSTLDLTELGHFCLVWGVHFFKYIVFCKEAGILRWTLF